jgi:flagellar biosynthesis/type III secretory pathway protein FliH
MTDARSFPEAATKEEWAERALRAEFRMEILEAELITAEQRGYANAMEAERKLHEERIEELEAKLKTAKEIGRAFEEDAGQLREKLAKAVKELQRLGFDFESVVGREIMGVGEDRG